MLKYNNKSRRLFLLNSCGLALSLPLLPSLLSRFVSDSIAMEVGTPNAYVFLRTYYGLYHNFKHVYGSEDFKDGWELINEKFNGSECINGEYRTKKLSNFKDHKINLFLEDELYKKGLEDYATVILGDSSFYPLGHFNSSVLGASTNAGIEHEYADFPNSNQSSIDVILQKKFLKENPNLKPIYIRPGGSSGTHNQFSFSFENVGDKKYIRPDFISEPEVLYNYLVTDIKNSIGGESAGDNNRTQKIQLNVLDHMKNEYKKLKSMVSYEEGLLLEEHAEKINSVSNKIKNNIINKENVTIEQNGSCKDPLRDSWEKNSYSEMTNQMNDLISMALACGVTKVVCIDFHHYQSHSVSHSSKPDGAIPHLRGVQEARDKFFDLALKLKNITSPTGNGNLLDSSVLYHTSEFGWEHHGKGGHSLCMLGKGNGTINSGKVYDFRRTEIHKSTGDKIISASRKFTFDGDGIGGKHGIPGWLPYNILLESLVRIAGIERSEYLKNKPIYGSPLTDYESGVYSNGLQKYHSQTVLSSLAPGIFRK